MHAISAQDSCSNIFIIFLVVGGTFLATGSSDPIIRVYMFSISGPERLCELEAHTVST